VICALSPLFPQLAFDSCYLEQSWAEQQTFTLGGPMNEVQLVYDQVMAAI
jgi:hypothetical protein